MSKDDIFESEIYGEVDNFDEETWDGIEDYEPCIGPYNDEWDDNEDADNKASDD